MARSAAPARSSARRMAARAGRGCLCRSRRTRRSGPLRPIAADPGLIFACSHYGELFASEDAGDSVAQTAARIHRDPRPRLDPELSHARNDGRRQPAEASLARRAGEAVAGLAARRQGADRGQARRDDPRDQAAGGGRDRHRQRRRAVAAAFRAWLSRRDRRDRLQPTGDDRDSRRPLPGRGADRHRPDRAPAQRPRFRSRHRPRPYPASTEIHPARTDDDRRHARRRPLWRPAAPGDGLCRPPQRRGARACGARRRCDPVRRAGLQCLP